jgi:hypothetical protein
MTMVEQLSPFVAEVVRYLQSTRHGSATSNEIMRHLLQKKIGKHPAAVSMHLTKLAWKQQYVTGYVDNSSTRVLMLTCDGRDLVLPSS